MKRFGGRALNAANAAALLGGERGQNGRGDDGRGGGETAEEGRGGEGGEEGKEECVSLVCRRVGHVAAEAAGRAFLLFSLYPNDRGARARALKSEARGLPPAAPATSPSWRPDFTKG